MKTFEKLNWISAVSLVMTGITVLIYPQTSCSVLGYILIPVGIGISFLSLGVSIGLQARGGLNA